MLRRVGILFFFRVIGLVLTRFKFGVLHHVIIRATIFFLIIRAIGFTKGLIVVCIDFVVT